MSADLSAQLNDLPWNDLKRFAKDKGVKLTGTRESITNELLSSLSDQDAGSSNRTVLSEKKANVLLSPKQAGPSRVLRSTAKKSTRKTPAGKTPAAKTPATEKIIFKLPVEDPVEDETETSNAEENVPPKELFPFSNAGPSPQIKPKTTRTPIIRSPEAEKTATPAKSARRKSTRSARKVNLEEAPEPTAEVITSEPETKATPAPALRRRSIRSARKSLLPTKDEASAGPSEVAEQPEESAQVPVAEKAEQPIVEVSPASALLVAGLRKFMALANSPSMIRAIGASIAVSITAAVVTTFISPVSAAASFGPGSIMLKGSSPMYFTQGDSYNELGVSLPSALQKQIVSHKMAAPSVAFEYSEAGVAFSEYLEKVGSFDVSYTISAPWLDEDIKLTRQVVVEDVNECTYSGSTSAFKSTCSDAETCTNTVGSFTCN